MKRVSLSVLGAVIGLLFFLPLLWVVTNSLRPGSETFAQLSPLSWRTFLELRPTLTNYSALLGGEIGRATVNSILVSAITVVVGLAVCASAAFGLAAFRFRGRGLVFAVVVLSFLVPFDAIAIPLSTMFRDWHLTNTFAGLVLPGIGNGMAIFLLRQFFLGIPGELVEAGRLDGLGWFGVFRWIYLPLSKPALIGAGLMLFLFQWQAYVWPLLIGTDARHILGPIALANLQGQNFTDYGLVFAGAVVLTVIPLVVIAGFQRYFVQSVSGTGLK
ncbi:carbohydrate ABC transporter permease [Kribbella sp. NPDC048915]|uniref:carbohydrate ABC transporter permease n=1 Tax=Kribbella sp. NPDC048915 TaxID=3155148 RepID=UPI0033E6FA42